MPLDKTIAFAREYGNPNTWHGEHRSKLLNLSELEMLMTYNAEVRGFLGYYSLADNLKDGGRSALDHGEELLLHLSKQTAKLGQESHEKPQERTRQIRYLP